MNKSLRLKLTFILVCVLLGIVLSTTLIGGLFLKSVYLFDKQQLLIQTYEEVNELYTAVAEASEEETESLYPEFKSGSLYTSPNIEFDEDFENKMEMMTEGRSTSIIIFRILGTEVNGTVPAITIYSSVGQGTDINQKMINDYLETEESEYIKSTDEYEIKSIYVERLDNDYLYLSASLDNGDNILIRSSIDNIESNVKLSNQFYTVISLLMLIVGTIVVYIISRSFTQPILDLAGIASRMANLDFTTKYKVNRKDEIGELGNSMNYLSSALEETLGELKSANAKLEKDLEKQTQIDNMRTEFLSNVSHELKTPIALIQGYAEGLMENVNDDEESRNFYCEVIMDEAAKMNNIVRKLLDLNQLEFGDNNINMEHFDIVSAVSSKLSDEEILFRQKEVTLECEMPSESYVWADQYMVEEVFGNYLSNAFNHVEGSRVIRVTIENLDSHVRVSVFNTGKQIPEEDISKIWEKFYKVDKARTREYGGSGVGLSIVKASMELLGQDYGVKNMEDGVCFWFELDATNGVLAAR